MGVMDRWRVGKEFSRKWYVRKPGLAWQLEVTSQPYFCIWPHCWGPGYSLDQGILAIHSIDRNSRPLRWVRSRKGREEMRSSGP